MTRRKVGGSYIHKSGEPIKIEFKRITFPLNIQVDPSVKLEIDPNKILFTLAFDKDGNKVDCWSDKLDIEKTFPR
jgi:hypothetical protein